MKKNILLSIALPLTASLSLLVPATSWSVALTEPAGSFADFAITGTTVAARPELAGVVLEDVISNYSFSGPGEVLQGTIQNRVIRSNDGTLDFYWRIRPDVALTNGDIEAFRVTGFSGFTLDADWRIDGLGTTSPNTARYFGINSGAVNFLFDPGVVIQDSFFFFIDTQATSYARTGKFDMLCAPSDCISPSYTTFAPVPVPAAAWLFGSGLIGLLGIGRRNRKL